MLRPQVGGKYEGDNRQREGSGGEVTEALRSKGLGTELAFKAFSLISVQSALELADVYGCQHHAPRLGTQRSIRSVCALEKLKV